LKRVTGIGGIFFKATDRDKLRNWYRVHLGIEYENDGGAIFKWRNWTIQTRSEAPSGLHFRRHRLLCSEKETGSNSGNQSVVAAVSAAKEDLNRHH
jgi:hypothetical protein